MYIASFFIGTFFECLKCNKTTVSTVRNKSFFSEKLIKSLVVNIIKCIFATHLSVTKMMNNRYFAWWWQSSGLKKS